MIFLFGSLQLFFTEFPVIHERVVFTEIFHACKQRLVPTDKSGMVKRLQMMSDGRLEKISVLCDFRNAHSCPATFQ